MVARSAYEPSEADILAVKSKLTPEESAGCSDDVIVRFLRAENGKQKQALARLQATLKWRRENRPEIVHCSLCRAEPGSHYMHPVAFDKQDQPVLYSSIVLAKDVRKLKGVREHIIMVLEQTFKLMKPGVEKCVWCSDFHGFSVADLNPALGMLWIEIAGKHYPERLACLAIIGAPSIFQGLWNIVQPLLDPVTRSKIRMIPYDIEKEDKQAGTSKLRMFMDETFSASTSAWMLSEMAENRLVGKEGGPKDKQYRQAELYSALTTGGDLKAHWGAPEFLQHLQKDPGVLLPNAGPSGDASTPDTAQSKG